TNFVEQVGDKYLVFTSIQMPLENLKTVNDNLAAKDHAIVVDPFYYTGNMVDLLHDDFSRVLNISMLFVFIVLLLSFRNVFVSIIAFLPMTLSWYVVQGIMAIFGIDFNLINIVISTFIFGIGVDYSIFVMDGMLAGVKSGDTQRLLYHKTAILLSAFVLIVCMGSLIFAVHPALSSVGVPALTGMISTILLTYTLEPFLFNLLIQTRFGKRVIERTKE
ncbi:MAG: MMPL family transporter, partial [Paludibacteraceae bacterium]|nr:MMPL family transporter [Paludibacteraceae bacterium]